MRINNLFFHAVRNPGAVVPFLLTLPKQFRLVSRLMGDRRVRLFPKLVVLASLVYLISPFDLLPDFLLPILGWADDTIVVIAAMRYLIARVPAGVLQEHVAAIEARQP